MKIVVYYPLFGSKYRKQIGQRETVADFVESSKAAVIADFAETKPGFSKLKEAIAKAKTSGASILFSRLGRYGTSLNVLRLLEDGRVSFFAVDDRQFNAKLLAPLLKSAGDIAIERRLKIKDGMAEAKEDGELFGSARQGAWTKKNTHKRGWKKANEAWVRIRFNRCAEYYGPILPIVANMLEKEERYEDIANALNEMGHVTMTGSPYCAGTVFKVFKRHGTKNENRKRGKAVGRSARLVTAK